METILGKKDAKIVSCHLGGSSSLCALRDGKSQATTMGMSPQSGLPQNNRVGDFDPFALPLLMRHTGLPLEKVLDQLANQGGLLGLSRGHSGDIRDLEQAAAEGNQDARLALDVYVAEIRRHLGGMVFLLGGADAIVFTGGIGENGAGIREAVCRDLESIGRPPTTTPPPDAMRNAASMMEKARSNCGSYQPTKNGSSRGRLSKPSLEPRSPLACLSPKSLEASSPRRRSRR
jgi:acetate kinase